MKKADICEIHDELVGELARIRLVQPEAASSYKEMGNTLSETMDRVTALERTYQTVTGECKKLQDKCLDLDNRSR